MTWPGVRATAVLLLLLASSPLVAAAAERDDGYVSGYAAAVLEREFQRPAPSLRVREGVVTIDATDLQGVDRATVVAALSRVRGVTRVEIVEAPAPPTAGEAGTSSPPLPSPDRVAVAHTPQRGPLPGGQLFDPLIADPRWPHFGASYQRYIDDKKLRDVAAVSFGETFTVYRDDAPAGWWEIGIQAGVFALFDLDAASKDLINADYFVAAVAGYRHDRLSLLGRLFHQSSHLGDEFLLRNRIKRLNLSYEGVDLKLSYEFFGDVLRTYVGGGYLFDRDPSALKPGSLQWGLEFRSPWPGDDSRIRPIAAVDVQNREQNDWHSDISVRAGLEFNGVLVTRKLQLLLEYFRGYSPNGQFYQDKIDYIGLGAHVHF